MTSETKNRIEVGTIKAEKTILEYRVANYESKLKDSLNQLIVRERKAEELTKSCNDLGKLNAKNEARLERLNETEKQLKETEELYIGLVSSNASNNTRAIDMENQVEIKSQELERKEKKILELTVSDSTNKEKARKLEVAESQLRLSQELLSEKEAEIISLHKQLAQYKIKDHDKELDLAEEALGNIAQEFKIERKSKRKLCDAYSRLVCLKNINNNKIGINEAKTEVLEIEDELIELLKSKNSGTEEKVLEKKVRLFSKHCEEVEQKKFDLEQ
jgi:hypothetical protein